MNKNVKSMFFVLTLVTLLLAVGAVSAVDNTNSTSATDSSVSDGATVSNIASDTVATEPVATTSNKDVDTKTIEKEDKNLKTSTKTVEVNNWNELKTAIDNITQDTENNNYIIELNDGTYKMPSRVNFKGLNITINGNGQTLEPKNDYIEMYTYGGILTFNDLTIESINIYNNVDLTLNNIVLYGGFENSKKVELNNVTVEEGSIWNYEDSNLIINNSTLDVDVYNEDGTIVIGDDVIFGEYFTIDDGEIIINDTNRLTPYLSEFNGDYVIENTEINRYISNYGNLTLKNVTVNMIISNSGNLILDNCTMNAGINNDDGTITIADDVILSPEFDITRDVGEIISNLTNITLYISQLNGDYVIENQVITHLSQNNGKLTIRNSTFTTTSFLTNNGNLTIEDLILNKDITNKGNLTVKNTTLNSTINLNKYNTYGSTLIIDDDVIIGEGFKINNGDTGSINNPPGTIIINDYSRIFKYMNNFKYEATVELGNYTKEIYNYGNLTIENTTFNAQLSPENRAILTNQKSGKIIIINSTTNTKNSFSNSATMEFRNSTIDTQIANSGTLIISEDTNIGKNFKITGNGEIISNHPQLMVDYIDIWETDATLNNQTITTLKTNYGIVTLNNCTINTTITNEGTLIIDENTVFGENAKITGNGKIETNNITQLLPFIDTINGNYEIKDTTLNKSYAFNGEITLTNCTINNPDNTNLGKLNLNNCTVDVGDNNSFLTNLGTVTISDDTNISGKIVNLVDNGTYIINKDTIDYFLNEKGLTSIVKPGNTLDIQGTIKLNKSLVINKPVNIISTTKDAYIDLNTTARSMMGDAPGNCFVINKDGAYTNVTGIYFHNTQLWIYNTHHVILDNISAVVENRTVGSGVGQTSIRANSTYITLKNSFIYTENNGGSSSVVLAWADNCIIENNTIQGVGYVGNLIYLTTYNVDIPKGAMPNVDNQILNNVIIGPEQSSPICVGIMLSGANNTIGKNKIYYKGIGGNGQWNGEGYTDTSNNIFFNNTQKYGQPEIELTVGTTEFTPGETTTIQVSIYYTNKVQTNITKGKITFKINSKTLKDTNGKVIYAKVVNGTATIENYIIPDTWKDGMTIEAIYSGSTQCVKLTSEKTNITITKEEPTLTIDTIEPATAGSTITLKATLSDTTINAGKIVFKINGKTVKDENGKVIYAKVTNGQVSIDYTIPESYKAGNYTITATYIGTDYDRLEDVKIFTVN